MSDGRDDDATSSCFLAKTLTPKQEFLAENII